MEAKELMIGDWVDETMVGRHQWYLYDFPDFDEKYVKPIPLTPEILEANGFEQNENVKGYQYPNDNIIFCLEELSRVFIFNGVYNDICINYVHELQHVLRLCGLNELADNFKA